LLLKYLDKTFLRQVKWKVKYICKVKNHDMVCNILFATRAAEPRIPELGTKHQWHLSRIKTLVIW